MTHANSSLNSKIKDCKVCLYNFFLEQASSFEVKAKSKKKTSFYLRRAEEVKKKISLRGDIARVKACSPEHLEWAKIARNELRKDNKDLKEKKVYLVVLAADKYVKYIDRATKIFKLYGPEDEKTKIAQVEENQARNLLAQRLRRLKELYEGQRLPEEVYMLLKKKDLNADAL